MTVSLRERLRSEGLSEAEIKEQLRQAYDIIQRVPKVRVSSFKSRS